MLVADQPATVTGHDRLSLAIRTIVITTRAAIRSQANAGHDDEAPGIARRGMDLLERVAAEIPADAPDGIRGELEDARRELSAVAGEEPAAADGA